MGDDVDEREMNVLRQKALSTLPIKVLVVLIGTNVNVDCTLRM